jgi:hypothetical protein
MPRYRECPDSDLSLRLLLLLPFLPLLAACPGKLGFEYVPPDGAAGGGLTGGSGGTGEAGATGAGGAIGAAGAGGTVGAGGDGSVATSCANAATVLATNCTQCHSGPTPPTIYANLDLQSPGVAARLVGVVAYTGASGACAGQGNLLDPGALPATGILIDKINFAQSCGVGMPSGLPMLSQSDVDCLQAWANGLVASVGSN